MNISQLLPTLPRVVLAVMLGGTACGPSEPPMHEPAPEPAPAAPPAPPAPAIPELPAVPAGARIAFGAPADGAEITGPLSAEGTVAVAVAMVAEGINVEPAGAVVPGSGHHHILIDTVGPAAGNVVPADDQHLHFGKAQTETTLQLKPGEHTLILQFADGIHRAYGPALSATIKIQVMGQGLAADSTAPTSGAAPTAAPAAEGAAHADHAGH